MIDKIEQILRIAILVVMFVGLIFIIVETVKESIRNW
jgi:hypothetical protein